MVEWNLGSIESFRGMTATQGISVLPDFCLYAMPRFYVQYQAFGRCHRGELSSPNINA